ncbi:MAG: hypothetical protein CM15mP12_0370 [Gammaproteobacteria bacterium]|nr:MAG: hypothetical protein CM15mP12_0370 [Gammaproteobacteria bacterium]
MKSKSLLFSVVFFNDDFTPMEFVVYVIQQFFNYDHAKATEVMLQIHNQGRGHCGAFSQEIAETKSQQKKQIFERKWPSFENRY